MTEPTTTERSHHAGRLLRDLSGAAFMLGGLVLIEYGLFMVSDAAGIVGLGAWALLVGLTLGSRTTGKG